MGRRLHFGRYELRIDERSLWVDGRRTRLRVHAFDVLVALVERRGQVVPKDKLLELVWPKRFVEENNLSVQISYLRKVLGREAIATIPAVGYQFTMEVDEDTPLPTGATATAPPFVQGLVLADPLPQGQGAWLAALPADHELAEDAWRDLEATAATIAMRHGGKACAGAGGTRTWAFGSAHAAAACGHELHGRMRSKASSGDEAPLLQLGLCAEQEASNDALAGPALAAGLARRARPGDTLVSEPTAGQLIIKLDGDLHPLADQDAASLDAPQPVLRLIAPKPDASGVRPLQRRHNLRLTVALIPFTPYTRDGVSMAVGDVIADQVISALSRSPVLNVISRLSTLPFRDRSASVRQISDVLAADFIVSGRYALNAGRVQLHVELADATSADVLWAHDAVDDERAALDLDSALVRELVAGIVQAVFVHEVRSVRGALLPDLASHTLLLGAISLLYRLSPRDFRLARDALETLHERAPRHPAPLAWLARWHLFKVVQGWSDNRDEDGRQALDHANRALDLDPDTSLALTMLGNVHTSWLKDLDEAGHLYDRALAVNPNESLAWLQKGNALSFSGHGAAALSHAEKALSLSPLDPARHFYLSLLAGAALAARNWERCIEASHQALILNQEHVSPHRMLAIALAMSGGDEARDSVRRVLRLEPGLTVAGFVARSPGKRSGLAMEFGRALHVAGLPLGDITLT